MNSKFIITDQIEIDAPAEKVWQVLTKAEYYRQWDDLPVDFTAKELKLGDSIEWEGYSRLTVTDWEVNKKLRMSLFLPRLDMNPNAYDVTYAYYLDDREDGTRLTIEIGDFSPLPDAQSYVDNTLEFVEVAKGKIKALAEKK